MNCFTQYLGKDGKPSATYYANVKTLGHERALKLYLAEMAMFATAKMSRTTTPTTVKELQKLDNDHRKKLAYGKSNKTKEQLEYGQRFANITGIREDIASHSFFENEDRIVTLLGRRQLIAEEFRSIVEEKRTAAKDPTMEVNLMEDEDKAFKAKIDKWIEDNPAKFDEYKTEVKSKWESQRDQASVIHNILEKALSLWEGYVIEGNSQKANQHMGLIKEAKISVAKETPKQNKFSPYKGNPKMDHLDVGLKDTLAKVISHIDTKYRPIEGWKILPETYLVSKEMKYTKDGESKQKTVHGISDIVLINEVLGQAVVFEYKTKSERSANSFDNPLAENMKGLFSTYGDTAENQTQIQMSMTAMILEEHGYSVLENNLVLLEGSFANNSKHIENVGKRQKDWYYGTINKSNIRSYQPMRRELNQLFEFDEEVEGSSIGESVDDFTQGQLEFSKDNKDEYIRKNMVRVKQTKSGTYTWYSTFSKKNESASSEEGIRKKIAEVYESYTNTKKKLPEDLRQFFRNRRLPQNSLMKSGSMSSIPSKLLAGGITPETHTLELARDIRGLEDVGDDALVATHNKSGEVILMSLMPRVNGRITFDDDGENKATTVFGAYLSDEGIKERYGSLEEIPQANVHNFTLMKLALIGSRLKDIRGDAVTGIPMLKVVSAYSDDSDNLQTSTMEAELSNLRKMRALAGENAPEALKELFDGGSNTAHPYTYRGDHVEYLIELIKLNKDPLRGETVYGSTSIKNKIKKHIRESASGGRDYELLRMFEQYGRRLKNVLRDEHGTNKTAISNDPRMVQFTQAYLSLQNVDTSKLSDYHTKNPLGSNLKTLDASKDYYGINVDRIISLAQQQSTTEISTFVRDMNEHVEKLYKVYGITEVQRMFSIDAYQGFENMYEDSEFTTGNEENWMKLKSEEDRSLHPDEVAFIKFMKDNLYRGYELMMGKDRAKGFKDKIMQGFVPLIQESKATYLQNSKSFGEVVQNSVDMLRGGKKTKKDLSIDSIGDIVESTFSAELDNSPGIQGSKQRRDLLGLSESGEQLYDRELLVMNPVAVMTNFMLSAVESEYMTNAAYASSVVISHLKVQEEMTGESTREIRDLISTLSAIRIHNVYKEEGAFAKYLDTIAKGVSVGMFWGNLRQMATESIVGTAQTTTTTLGNWVMGMLPKTEEEVAAAAAGEKVGPRFTAKSMKYAAGKVTSKLGAQLIEDLGLHRIDPEYFKSREYIITKKKSLFKPNVGFAPTQALISRAIALFSMAQLAEQGILQSYSKEEETGKYIYKEENDPRFYVYDEELLVDGKTIGHKNPPSTDEEKRRFSLWKSHREQLAIENGIGENGRMIIPLTSKENQSIRYYAQKLISTLDSSKTTMGEATVMWRMALRFKRWMVQKGVNYWQKRHTSDLNGRWVYNTDAEGDTVAVWEGQPMEGMLNSAVKLFTDIKNMGLKKGFHSMDQIQKENLSKMLMDLLMMLFLFEIAHLLEKSGIKDTTLGNELFRATQNSIGDMMPMIAIGTAFTQEPFGSIGVVQSAVENMVDFTYYSTIASADPDITEEEALEKARAARARVFNTAGVVRAAKGTAEWLQDGF
jgi:hypothetical protein